MEPETREALAEIFNSERSFYEQADALVRLLTQDNVSDVMGAIPMPFRADFRAFATEAFVPPGPRLVIAGPPLPASNLEALRGWIARTAAQVTPEAKPGWGSGLQRFTANAFSPAPLTPHVIYSVSDR